VRTADSAIAAWGVRPIQHLHDLGLLGPHLRLVHMNHVDESELEILAFGERIATLAMQAPRLGGQLDLAFVHASQFHADDDLVAATVGVDRGCPALFPCGGQIMNP